MGLTDLMISKSNIMYDLIKKQYSPKHEMFYQLIHDFSGNTLAFVVVSPEKSESDTEPHFLLFSAEHLLKNEDDNQLKFITKVALPKDFPENSSEIHSIAGYDPVPEQYKKTTLEFFSGPCDHNPFVIFDRLWDFWKGENKIYDNYR